MPLVSKFIQLIADKELWEKVHLICDKGEVIYKNEKDYFDVTRQIKKDIDMDRASCKYLKSFCVNT